jgi:hypothetical protein
MKLSQDRLSEFLAILVARPIQTVSTCRSVGLWVSLSAFEAANFFFYDKACKVLVIIAVVKALNTFTGALFRVSVNLSGSSVSFFAYINHGICISTELVIVAFGHHVSIVCESSRQQRI